jgi:nucleotide-binding universal stress UspA family protein
MTPLRTILCPIDLAEPCESAFQLACSLARDRGACVLVLYVYPPPSGHGEVVARRQPDGYEEDLWRSLGRYQAQVPEGVYHRLAEGEPAREILRVAREAAAELIVLGTHGRRGLPRLVMGSVAEQVVRTAPCPVLTIKVPFAKAGPAPEGHPTTVSGARGQP